MDHPTEPDSETIDEDEAAAQVRHEPDRKPTDDEEALADASYESLGVEERAKAAEHEDEMIRIGAEAKGEGRIS